MHRSIRRIAIVAATVLGVLARADAFIVQVTDNVSAGPPSITFDGHFIAFSDGNVYVYDVVKNTTAAVTVDGGLDPTISGDGKWVAFTSSADFGRNPDGSDEIFRYYRPTRRFYQMTRDNNGDGASEFAVINGNGMRFVFETSSNLRNRNPDFSNEVYLDIRGTNSAMSKDPNGDGESRAPAISADGKFVVFQTTSDLKGRNADFSQELMLYDATARQLSQLTNDAEGNGSSGTAAISGDGRFIAFISSSNVDLQNPDGVGALFLYTRLRRSFTVISKTPDGLFDADQPSLSDDGRWIAFVSGFDVNGNPDFNSEIFIYDRARRVFTQVTDSTGCSSSNPKISGDGSRVTFLSDCDLAGGNSDGSLEVFVAGNPILDLGVHSEGPVSLTVRDGNGLVVTPTVKTIPRSTYVQGDFDNDTVPEDRATIPQALEGSYSITVSSDSNVQPTDPVSLDASLNGVTVPLATGTVADVTPSQYTFSNQGFLRPTSRMTPIDGTGSVVSLSTRLLHPPADTGAVSVRFNDGTNDITFDCGRIENYQRYSGSRNFLGTISGFNVKVRIKRRTDDTTGIVFSARNGDLSAFEGTGHVSMVMVVQIGPDTYMYNWRFLRTFSGKLILKK